jgi:hypothetical protein
MCVCILALFIQQAQRMRRSVLPSVSRLPVPYFPTLSHKVHDFQLRNEHKICVLISSTAWSETFLIIRRNKRDIVVIL